MFTCVSQDGIDQYSEIETEDSTIQHCLTPELTANAAESVFRIKSGHRKDPTSHAQGEHMIGTGSYSVETCLFFF